MRNVNLASFQELFAFARIKYGINQGTVIKIVINTDIVDIEGLTFISISNLTEYIEDETIVAMLENCIKTSSYIFSSNNLVNQYFIEKFGSDRDKGALLLMHFLEYHKITSMLIGAEV